MAGWELNFTDKYSRMYKQYEKKSPNELIAVLSNLDFYFSALNNLGDPLLIKAGFIHREPDGIKAIDQKGGKRVKRKTKLKQTRLYIYPAMQEKILYLLTIGDKNSQKEDINFCRNFVKQIRRETPL